LVVVSGRMTRRIGQHAEGNTTISHRETREDARCHEDISVWSLPLSVDKGETLHQGWCKLQKVILSKLTALITQCHHTYAWS